MNTQILEITPASLTRAADLIVNGQVVAIPTETVYGLAANALNIEAVKKIFEAKQRPADNPLIVHIYQKEQAYPLCHWTQTADLLAEAFWPGPLTLLLNKKELVPSIVTAGLHTVAIRLPEHQGALAFLKTCDLPIAAPSANRSGYPSPTSAQHVYDDLCGRIPLILDGGDCRVGLESTVLDISGKNPVILRPGFVTAEQIAMVTGSCEVADSVMRPLSTGEQALSPGMRYRHYAPQGQLTLFDGDPLHVAQAIISLYDHQPDSSVLAMEQHLPLYGDRLVYSLGEDAASAAHRLFYLLRSLDKQGIRHIYCESLPQTGLGLAVMNRLARAAEFDIKNV
ncbi:MAG: threonylcarbamoyl-AMP synthase [Clostridiales bacterium]|nr:threonylcarbamoyl-AMP synthase [Clostridiales bacterium]